MKKQTKKRLTRRVNVWASISLLFLLCGSLSTGYMYYQRNLYRDHGMALARFTNDLYSDTVQLEEKLNQCRNSGMNAL